MVEPPTGTIPAPHRNPPLQLAKKAAGGAGGPSVCVEVAALNLGRTCKYYRKLVIIHFVRVMPWQTGSDAWAGGGCDGVRTEPNKGM